MPRGCGDDDIQSIILEMIDRDKWSVIDIL